MLEINKKKAEVALILDILHSTGIVCASKDCFFHVYPGIADLLSIVQYLDCIASTWIFLTQVKSFSPNNSAPEILQCAGEQQIRCSNQSYHRGFSSTASSSDSQIAAPQKLCSRDVILEIGRRRSGL